jgi:dextranase
MKMAKVEVLPTRASFDAGADVRIEVRELPEPGSLTVWRLGDQVGSAVIDSAGEFSLGPLPPGGYGVELAITGGVVRTAVEVCAPGERRLRYGFVADYADGRDAAPVADTVRRLHLTGVQFYDWAYRHADLLGGGEDYTDALDQPVSLATVRRLVSAVQQAGARALGYAAVYAAGPGEWSAWQHLALLDPDGRPHGLGDFLFLLDPAADEWSKHFAGQLQEAVRRVGFDGFHLDQYGYPKWATRPDGGSVDVAASFVTLIERLRADLPDAYLVFNNVNNFPTWRTARAPQDAVYVEVWPPHTTLGSLADVAGQARVEGAGKPVVIAAYQQVYDLAPTEEADLATAFTMATLYSHGATQLLAGEADRILVDPYYVRNHRVGPSTAALLKRWYDFLVEHGEILLGAGLSEVTGSMAGTYNGDCDVTYPDTTVSGGPDAGSVWRRIVRDGDRLVVHLVNLTGQTDTLWDAPRRPVGNPGRGTLRVRRTRDTLPRIRVADPDRSPRLTDVPVVTDGDYAVAELPAPHVWQLLVIDQSPAREAM